MSFFQDPPRLGNQYDGDELLREYLERVLPAGLFEGVIDEYRTLGELAGGELYEAKLADRLNEPVLTTWDPWGRRADQIEVTAVWKRAQVLAAEYGLVGVGYEDARGEHARVDQFIRNYLVDASLDVYSCPLAMTDGAAKTLLDAGNEALIDRAVPRLTSRDPSVMWTSGQWMTERIGGSDVGQTETVARNEDGQWRLYGTKWFTSATTSQMAITLARPEGNPPGSKGLAMFYLELRDDDGRLQGIEINRLKDKFGTRKVPTAELTLDGAPATPVTGLTDGVRNITPMLTITRLWNAVGAAAGMRRATALARDYARRRKVFGDLLIDKPLHVDTLAGIIAEAEGGFLIAFRVAEVLGKIEHGSASDQDKDLLRMRTPITKLITGKQAVIVASEAMESFGGAGYVEDTGLPRLLADAQVLPIWEGTTNVLSLDALRALKQDSAWGAVEYEVRSRLERVTDPRLEPARATTAAAVEHASQWLQSASTDRGQLEAGARRFAMTVGRAIEAALLAEHAQWCLDHEKGERALAAAVRFSRNGVDLIDDGPAGVDAALLV